MRKLTIEEFIKESILIHGEKYDYSESVYAGRAKRIKIICPIHGEFEQFATHHVRGHGCSQCSKNKKLTTESFIKAAILKHGNKYNYSKAVYENNSKIEIICQTHGSFFQKSNSHLSGRGCPKCVGKYIYGTEEFIDRSNKIHDYKYDYSETLYKGHDYKVTIICPEHGEFIQSANGHLNGRGCAICSRLNNGWTKTKFKMLCSQKDKSPKLYLVELYNPETAEKFYKIGITSREVENRMQGIPYNFRQEILYQHENSDIIFDLERLLHKVLKDYKYKPLIEFGGHTECFQFNMEVMKKFKDYIG
jgi:hypothetical protein